MYAVYIDFWADGNILSQLGEVFTDVEDALTFAKGFSGLGFGPTGYYGELATVYSLTLDGASTTFTNRFEAISRIA
jgi:hypothetical protein